MASPLAWFRRNQKGMLIFFGVLLMAVFGLPSVFFNMTPQGGSDPEMAETVVRYNGGSYTRGEFRDYRYRHAQAVRFVGELQQAAVDREGAENYRQRAPMITAIDTNASPEELDRQVMRRIILTNKARELGMMVGDDAVMDYLRAIGGDELTEQDMKQFAFDLYRGNPDFNVIKAQLKRELAIQQMFGIVASGLPRSPNITDAWENFLKLNKRRSATVLEFPVDRFVAQVTDDPSLDELRDLFNLGEYEFPDPTNEEPGFKARQQVKAVVLTANMEDFLTNAEANVKPEEIQALYDDYVEQKHPLVMETILDSANEGDDPDAPPEFNLDEEGSSEGGDAAGSEMEGDSAATEEAGESTEAEGNKEGESGEGESGEGESGEGESVEGSGGDGNQEEGDGSISGPWADLNQEEGTQEEGTQEEGTQEEGTQEEGSQEKKTEETGQSESTQDENAAQKGEDTAGGTEQESMKESAEDLEIQGPVQEGSDDPVQVPAGPPTADGILDGVGGAERRVKELDEELSTLLRRELAREPAIRAMATAITEAAGDIGDYGSDLQAYENTKEGPVDEREPEPDPLDLESVARDYKLQLQQTELLDYSQLRDEPVGQIGISVQRVFMGRPIQDRLALSDYLFTNFYQLDEWVPETLVEFGNNNQHVVFFVEKQGTRVRTFDEAREDVEKFWRNGKALELARASAQEVADDLNANGTTIAEKFPEDANDVGEFSWHVSGRIYPELPQGVLTGAEFMETAFGLDVGQCGVAIDATRENVYVIQVSAIDTRTDEELRETFFNELAANNGMSMGIRGLYELDTQEFIRKYFDDINEELNIQWLAH